MAQTRIEKIAQKFAVDLAPGVEIHSGDYVSISPSFVMTHDNTGAVIPKFKAIGANNLANPHQVVITLDHNVQDKSEKNLEKYRKIESFAKSMDAHFFPAGRGIGHQIMCEEGFAFPDTIAVASDSHSNMYGGLGCLGTPIVRTDAAAIWATGRTWWQVPPIAKVVLTGSLFPGVSGKDVILALCGYFNHDEVLNHAVEFTGEGVAALKIEERLTIANMTTEWGALAGLFPVDSGTISWLEARLKKNSVNTASEQQITVQRLNGLLAHPINADAVAFYSRTITIDLSTISPGIAGPNTVKDFKTAAFYAEHEQPIQKAYLLSCVNGRTDDFAAAASVVKGKHIAGGVSFYISAASNQVQADCETLGYWQTLIDAGATALPPGCGPCIGLGIGLLEDGEAGISATNRNFKGRMGSPNALAFLASPFVVASSALEGKISYTWQHKVAEFVPTCVFNNVGTSAMGKNETLPGFPESISAELIFCPKDNLNTDGIYPGKYTYQDDFTPEQQASVVMENYDPEFRAIANQGDVLAGGFNFGTGSSREQAATALKYKGIPLVIAGSFNETYKRNALNNGFLLVDCPEFISWLKEQFGTDKLTIKTGLQITIDFTTSTVTADKKQFHFGTIGKAAQELIICGGLENWIKKQISQLT